MQRPIQTVEFFVPGIARRVDYRDVEKGTWATTDFVSDVRAQVASDYDVDYDAVVVKYLDH